MFNSVLLHWLFIEMITGHYMTHLQTDRQTQPFIVQDCMGDANMYLSFNYVTMQKLLLQTKKHIKLKHLTKYPDINRA